MASLGASGENDTGCPVGARAPLAAGRSGCVPRNDALSCSVAPYERVLPRRCSARCSGCSVAVAGVAMLMCLGTAGALALNTVSRRATLSKWVAATSSILPASLLAGASMPLAAAPSTPGAVFSLHVGGTTTSSGRLSSSEPASLQLLMTSIMSSAELIVPTLLKALMCVNEVDVRQ